MGDRCDVYIHLRKRDQERVAKEFGEETDFLEEDDSRFYFGEPTTCIQIQEVNYGGQTEFENLAKEKIPFLVEHTDGGSYHAGCYVNLPDDFPEMETFEGSLLEPTVSLREPKARRKHLANVVDVIEKKYLAP